MSQTFLRDGRWVDAETLKKLNEGEIIEEVVETPAEVTTPVIVDEVVTASAVEEGDISEQGSAHYLTQEEVDAAPELGNVGDLIYIPLTDEETATLQEEADLIQKEADIKAKKAAEKEARKAAKEALKTVDNTEVN